MQEALRLSVRRTCTPASTCNLRVCAYRLRDITNWRTLQGAVASIPETAGESAAVFIRVAVEGVIDSAEQAAYLFAVGAGLLVEVLLFV